MKIFFKFLIFSINRKIQIQTNGLEKKEQKKKLIHSIIMGDIKELKKSWETLNEKFSRETGIINMEHT